MNSGDNIFWIYLRGRNSPHLRHFLCGSVCLQLEQTSVRPEPPKKNAKRKYLNRKSNQEDTVLYCYAIKSNDLGMSCPFRISSLLQLQDQGMTQTRESDSFGMVPFMEIFSQFLQCLMAFLNSIICNAQLHNK